MRVQLLFLPMLSTAGCLLINDGPLEPAPAPLPAPPPCCFEGEGEGEGEGEPGDLTCAVEFDCFSDDVSAALDGYGMCVAGVCEPLFSAEWSAARFELAVDVSGGPLDVDAPRYFAESYYTVRGNGETLTCLDVITGPFDPDFVPGPPYVGNGVPVDANTTGGASILQATTTQAVRIDVPAIVGPHIVRFGIHDNDDPATVPVAIACVEVDFAAGLDVEEQGFANAPFLGGVVLSPVP